MLTTQQFADLCDTTKKTIIHYDRISLLKPKQLRGTHRLYDIKQVLTFQKIYLLKSLGLTLEQTRHYLSSQKDLTKLFKDRKESLSIEKEILERRINRLSEYIKNLEKSHSLILPKIKTVKPYTLYTIEKVGRYVDIGSFDRELGKLIGDDDIAGLYVTLFKDEEYAPDQSKLIIGSVVFGQPKQLDRVQLLEVPAHKVVYYKHVGPFRYLSYVWQFLNKYIEEKHLKRDLRFPVREFYLRGVVVESNEENYVTEIQIPIL